jgi:hypothetical protein
VFGDNLLLDLTPSEVDLIRTTLRNEEERHKRQGFIGLAQASADLREKINNAMIDSKMKAVTR